MGFFDKLKSAIRKIRAKLIVGIVLVLVILVWGVAPLAVATAYAKNVPPEINFDWEQFFIKMGEGLSNPLNAFKAIFETKMGGLYFWNITKFFFGIYFVAAFVGIVRALPKHEYEDIENGSSDWSEGGEQYRVLSKNKGIVLAEKNYLPVDKRGNVNVLVVRRFWCW